MIVIENLGHFKEDHTIRRNNSLDWWGQRWYKMKKDLMASYSSKQTERAMWLWTWAKNGNSEDRTKSSWNGAKSQKKFSPKAGLGPNQGTVTPSGLIQSFYEIVTAICLRMSSLLNRNVYYGYPVSVLLLCHGVFWKERRRGVETYQFSSHNFSVRGLPFQTYLRSITTPGSTSVIRSQTELCCTGMKCNGLEKERMYF